VRIGREEFVGLTGAGDFQEKKDGDPKGPRNCQSQGAKVVEPKAGMAEEKGRSSEGLEHGGGGQRGASVL